MKKEVNKEHTTLLDNRNEEAIPALYQVVVFNDDFTPMEFVIGILEKCFYMDRRQAAEKMLEAHITGRAVCGIFSKDFAETKVAQVSEYAQSNGHPLNCSMEVA